MSINMTTIFECPWCKAEAPVVMLDVEGDKVSLAGVCEECGKEFLLDFFKLLSNAIGLPIPKRAEWRKVH